MLKIIFLILISLTLNLFSDVAKVVAITGDVMIIREGKVIELNSKSVLLKNDEIKTSKNAKVQLFFKDETIITIGKESSFKVREYIFEKKNTNHSLDFSMLKGVFKIISGSIGKINPDNFKIKTKSASIGIRGTQIDLNISVEREIISCTQGTIVITLMASKEVIVLNAGESIVIDIKSKQVKKISNAKAVNVYSFDQVKSVRVDSTYDKVLIEKESKPVNPGSEKSEIEELSIGESITNAVDNAFSKGNVVDYSASTLTGTIDEKNDGLSSFDTSNAIFDLTVDFGKARDDNPVTGDLSIQTATSTSKVQKLIGNINNLNKIEMTYEVKESDVFVTKNASGNLEFNNDNLDIKGKDIEVRSYIQNEEIIIKNVELKAK